ncbi:MAG: 2,3-diphosphoglycerate-dependent phosphoglycerate mutase [Methanothrix sp.]|nr:2,3-diphosphoglycerate-dependent phosphoglycerate mutase [Methanothrix sp.]
MATLVFLRHGQSLFNQEGRFTGWMDIDLSRKGREEAAEAGQLLKRSGLDFDIAFTSVLKRAIRTAWIVLDEMDRMWIPLLPCWRLNERSYGALEGEKKSEMDEKYGPGQVRLWRRGFSERPPALSRDDRRFPGRDDRYRDIEESLLPRTESLQDAMQRLMPLWIEQILPQLERGRNVLVVSHGNTIRSLVKHIEDISDQDIEKIEIPTASFLLYEMDDRTMLLYRRHLAGPPAGETEE